MVKTIRLSDEMHTELVILQGKIQSEKGETTSMDDVIEILTTVYKINSRKRK